MKTVLSKQEAWLTLEEAADRDRYVSGKVQMVSDFQEGLAVTAAQGGLSVIPSTPNTFWIRPLVEALNPGKCPCVAIMSGECESGTRPVADTDVTVTVQLFDPSGRLLDEVRFREVVYANYSPRVMVQRMSKAAGKLGRSVGKYLIERVGQ